MSCIGCDVGQVNQALIPVALGKPLLSTNVVVSDSQLTQQGQALKYIYTPRGVRIFYENKSGL